MPTTRPRRIVKRAVMAVAGCVLLVVWYVAAWLVVSNAYSQGIISIATAQRLSPAFSPLVAYCRLDYPGARPLSGLWWSAIPGFNETPTGTPEQQFAWRQRFNRELLLAWIQASGLAPPPPQSSNPYANPGAAIFK